MAPKKAAKQLKEGEVDYLDVFTKLYRKTLKEYEGLEKMKDVDRILNVEIPEFGDDIPFWYLTSEFDPMAYRVLMQCLTQSGYVGFKALRLWQTGGGDECVRSTCQYITSERQHLLGQGLNELQLTAVGMTPLGCSFIGKAMGFRGNPNIEFLRLDYNNFGSAGLAELAKGLAVNPMLKRLDLNYCGIDEEGGKSLFEILLYNKSQLTQLELRGNSLRNAGLMEMIRGLEKPTTKLVGLDVADNNIGEEVIEALVKLFQTKKNIERYDLLGNLVTDAGATKIIQGMIGQTHIKELRLPEECSAATFEALATALGAGTATKGKKKK
jgi:hypothetical protein